MAQLQKKWARVLEWILSNGMYLELSNQWRERDTLTPLLW
jgi:hypothetical protein